MPTVGFNIDSFTAAVAQRGLLGTNLFMAYFPVPPGMLGRGAESTFLEVAREMNLWCDSASIPEVFFNTVDVRRYGFGPTEKVVTNAVFNDVPLTFRVDARARTWQFFREWMMLGQNFNASRGIDPAQPTGNISGQRVGTYESGYIEDVATNVIISAFNDHGDETLRVVLRQAYPVAVSPMMFDWGDRNGLAKFTAVFTMMDWYHDFDTPSITPPLP